MTAIVRIVSAFMSTSNWLKEIPNFIYLASEFATRGTLTGLGELAIYMATTATASDEERSRRVPASLVECGRDTCRCFFEMAASGLALNTINAVEHPFVVSLSGNPSDRLWRGDNRLSEQFQQIEPFIESIVATMKTTDNKIDPVSYCIN